jgi:glyoxylase-like metal-dependent hydrolase (beta-lactamase superfamily II)
MADAEVHLLDIGTAAYGDCVVLQFNNGKPRHVLIDGGHSDDKQRLLTQFGEIIGGSEPFTFDLVMISHAHGDHIGALPALVTEGHIVAKHALIPDVAMAFDPDRLLPVSRRW